MYLHGSVLLPPWEMVFLIRVCVGTLYVICDGLCLAERLIG